MIAMSVSQPVDVDPAIADFAAIGRWMDERGLPAGEVGAVSSIGGGTQNIMLRFTRGGREYVLRRGPKHLRAKSNDVIRRESRLLGAIDGKRTLDEIAMLVAKRYGLHRSEARGAVERILLEIFDTTADRTDSVTALE